MAGENSLCAAWNAGGIFRGCAGGCSEFTITITNPIEITITNTKTIQSSPDFTLCDAPERDASSNMPAGRKYECEYICRCAGREKCISSILSVGVAIWGGGHFGSHEEQ